MSFASIVAGALGGIAETVTLIRTSGGSYTAATGRVSAETEANYTAQGIFTTYDDQLIDGATIQSGDLKCEILGASVITVPVAGDKLLRGTTELRVVNVKTRPFKGENVAYNLQVRGNA